MAEEKDTKQEAKDIVKSLIFDGIGLKDIEYANKTWTFKTLTVEEMNDVWAIASASKEDNYAFALAYQIEILQTALVKINKVPVDDESRELIGNLPEKIIADLYAEYEKISRLSVVTEEDVQIIDDLIENDNWSQLKFDVMHEFGILPTDPRVKEMNEHQWVWLHRSLNAKRKEKSEQRKAELDYLAFYVNPELQQKVRDVEDKKKKNGKPMFSKNGVTLVEEHDEVNPYNENVVTHYGATTVDEDFEKKLQMFMGEDQNLTELDSDTQKGNIAESKEDFIARAMQMGQFIEQENQKKLEQDAKEAGVNPEELDSFEIH